ncbi:uncharacterized protein CTHT_0004000 [Thermochaetoides thermophila DSM 1495]|uniref:BTB domain transcription factor n=1 Tax=Chaetomium thermophilum (strain DSM 1495 / CBS 144.50 / IMI 039719) TaxID=759272 RepID=G0RZS3_CHATD|nr:hypothetical protein CTHT_0004000 [Thermochaetoides thermophila DSM 1495]EGS23701.1 hypothetical protein CTHT_0004000 [Thermochaetoides thermophila DSM 1495]
MTTTRSASKKQEPSTSAPLATEAQPGSKHKTEEVGEERAPSPKRSKKEEPEASASGNPKETKEVQGKGETKKTEEEGAKLEKKESKQAPTPRSKEEASAVEPQGREEPEALPASILEKGIIYFFFRGRVNVDQPSSVSEIARSYIILRPIEKDAKLGSGPIGDAGNSRVCVIPKKVLPQSGRDRWTGFVEKAGTSFQQIKEEFLASSEYQTKTAGERHVPAAIPIGEGIYAINSTERESHLAYLLTIPKELGEVQKEMGLKEKGSFIISTKNPEYPGPQNARLPRPPEYPRELLEEFRSLRWIPTQPKHLNYVNTQFLLIGESSGIKKAFEAQKEDKEEGRTEPTKEMEQLAEEDSKRMKELRKDELDCIFADLQAHADDYPKLQTTF